MSESDITITTQNNMPYIAFNKKTGESYILLSQGTKHVGDVYIENDIRFVLEKDGKRTNPTDEQFVALYKEKEKFSIFLKTHKIELTDDKLTARCEQQLIKFKKAFESSEYKQVKKAESEERVNSKEIKKANSGGCAYEPTPERVTLPVNTRPRIVYVRRGIKYISCTNSKTGYLTLKSALKKCTKT